MSLYSHELHLNVVFVHKYITQTSLETIQSVTLTNKTLKHTVKYQNLPIVAEPLRSQLARTAPVLLFQSASNPTLRVTREHTHAQLHLISYF